MPNALVILTSETTDNLTQCIIFIGHYVNLLQQYLREASSYMVFAPSVEGSTEGGTLRVPKAPRGAPEVDPDTRGRKTL